MDHDIRESMSNLITQALVVQCYNLCIKMYSYWFGLPFIWDITFIQTNGNSTFIQ